MLQELTDLIDDYADVYNFGRIEEVTTTLTSSYYVDDRSLRKEYSYKVRLTVSGVAYPLEGEGRDYVQAIERCHKALVEHAKIDVDNADRRLARLRRVASKAL